ncbi:MAG TPA: FtsX-like permease family protein, partial [Acidimicrobiales bacterium]|nr:FtsX-like permease family protein [Acidimicrobiales bacterium]
LLTLVALMGSVLFDAARESRRLDRRRWRPASRVAARASAAGAPTPAVEGLRLALDPGGADSSVPVRSVIVGAVAAVAILATTLTFGASLTRLVSRPSLYGWNWSAMLLGGYAAQEDLPGPEAAATLNHDRLVAAWSGVYLDEASVDGVRVPALGVTPGARVAPPILTGHGVDTADQIVLGADTLAALHLHVGSTVTVAFRHSATARLRVVGVAVLPALTNGGGGAGSHLEMASGALVPSALIPANLRNIQASPIPGPQAILVRYRSGVTRAAERADLIRLSVALNSVKGDQGASGGAVDLLRPAEIVNYRSSTSVPTALAALIAAGALGALGLTLASSVRRRRRDLAILRVVGFTRSQLTATVASQATTVALLGVVVGVPVGALAGRALWSWFADQVHVVDSPALPIATYLYVALAALLLANAAALLPARAAARIPAALALRSE